MATHRPEVIQPLLNVAKAITGGDASLVERWMLELIADTPEPNRSAPGWDVADESFPNEERVFHSLLGGDWGREWALSQLDLTGRIQAATDDGLEALSWEIHAIERELVSALTVIAKGAKNNLEDHIARQLLGNQPIELHRDAKVDRARLNNGEVSPMSLIEKWAASSTSNWDNEISRFMDTYQADLVVASFETARAQIISTLSRWGNIPRTQIAEAVEDFAVEAGAAATFIFEETVKEVREVLQIRIQAGLGDRLRQLGARIRQRVASSVAIGFGGSSVTPATPMARGTWMQRVLTALGLRVQDLVWMYGDEATRNLPFDEHRVFSGDAFSSDTDERLLTPPRWAFLGSHFHPGDHNGCQCLWRIRFRKI